MKTAALVTKEDFLVHSREDHENFQSIHTKLDKIASDHPTNGELGLMIANIGTTLDEVRIQTTKTNGRVTILEAITSENKGKGEGARAMWGWIVAGVSFAILLANFLLPKLK